MIPQQERRLRYQNGTLERMTRKSGPDIWTYRWVERGTGKRRRIRLGTTKELTTMQAVKKAADGYRLSANRESDVVVNATMAAVLDRYERELITPYVKLPLGAIDDGRISSMTARAYRSYLRHWICPRWGKYNITELAKPQLRSSIEDWLRELSESGTLAPKSVRSIGSLLRLVFRQAVKWGYLEHSPMDYVDLPAGSTVRKKEPRALTPAEYMQLITLFGPRERLAIEIAGWLGTWRGQGFGLRWQDLDLERDVVTFRQGFVSGRVTPLKTEAPRAQMAFLQKSKMPFWSGKSTRPTANLGTGSLPALQHKENAHSGPKGSWRTISSRSPKQQASGRSGGIRSGTRFHNGASRL